MSVTLKWIIEAAWSANLTADPLTWTWVDISAYVHGTIDITRGQPDEASQTQPSMCSFRLRNTDSRFTPRHPSSPYYPNVTLGTPIRVRLDTTTGLITNLVGNGAFETNTTGWSSNGRVTITRSTVQAHAGAASMLCTPTGGGVSGPLLDLIPVTPGATYLASMWAFSALGWPTVGVSVLWFDSTGTLMFSDDRSSAWPAASWKQDVQYFRVPSGAAFLQLMARQGGAPAAANLLYVDDVVLTPACIRFQGGIDGFAPVWPAGNSNYAEVILSAAGDLKRLNQGKALETAIRRAIVGSQPTPTAYWSLEDGAQATVGAGVIGGTVMRPFVGTHPSGAVVSYPTFSSGQLAPWLKPVSVRSGSAGLTILWAPIPTTPLSPSPVIWTIDFLYQSGTDAGDSTIDVNPLYLGGATGWPQLTMEANVEKIAASFNGEPEIATVVRNLYDQRVHHIRITAQPAAAKVTWTMWVDGVSVQTSTTTGNMTLPALNTLGIASAAGGSVAIGHVAVWSSAIVASPPSVTTMASAAQGWAGETANARVVRLGAEQVYQVFAAGGIEQMGPQSPLSLGGLLREVEVAEDGILVDGLGPGVTIVGRDQRASIAASLALDANQAQVKLPFEPVENDQRIVNNLTVTRIDGGSASYVDATSIAAKGEYVGALSIRGYDDNDLTDQAAWRAHVANVEEMRAPNVELSLTDRPELINGLVNLDIGDRYTIANMPVQYPPGGLDLVLEQYSESLEAINWTATLIGSAFAPWRVAVVANPSGDAGEFVGHLDTDDSACNASVTTTATSIVVKTNSGPLWTTTADDFPFDIQIGAERIRVTTISGSSSPQTFSVARAINGVSQAHLTNDPVSLWAPLVLGL